MSLPHAPSSDHAFRFGGISRLYGEAGLAQLRASHVCIIGLGGVGSWIAESLARSGIGEITLIDADEVCVSNTNRQIHALAGNYGKSKARVLAERIRQIAPECRAHPVETFFTEKNVDELLGRNHQVVVDAIDGMNNKALLIASCKARGLPVIVCGGVGGRRDPTRLRICDFGRSQGDTMLQLVRRKLRREYGFPKFEGKNFHIACVYSDEPQVEPVPCEGSENAPVKLDCATGFGAVSHLTGAMGFFAAHQVIETLLNPTTAIAAPGVPST